MVNAYIARGVDAGGGMRDAARIKYEIGRDQEIRNRNAYVQDRAFNAQQEYRNSAAQAQQEAAEADHARWVIGQVQKATTPEQARAVYEWGMQDAQQRGFDTSDAPSWEQIQGMYAPPANNAEWGRNLVTGQDAQGNPVFLQTSESGQVRAVEDYKPPGPTKKELEDERAATARADQAEVKAQDAKQKAEAAKATKAEVEQAARDLLEPGIVDAVKSVYGAYQGAIPSLREGTIDAEAKVDRLVDMLTLENTSKMTGVLSESDIKILQRAGTILANKRISDKAALEEIKRIGGIFEKIDGGNQVGRFTVEEVD